MHNIPPTIHQGGRVEGAPISAEAPKNEFATHKNVELPPDVEQAGVVVKIAPNINPGAFTESSEPKIVLPSEQTPAWLAQQIAADEKVLKNDPKNSISWLGRARIKMLEVLRIRKLEAETTSI